VTHQGLLRYSWFYPIGSPPPLFSLRTAIAPHIDWVGVVWGRPIRVYSITHGFILSGRPYVDGLGCPRPSLITHGNRAIHGLGLGLVGATHQGLFHYPWFYPIGSPLRFWSFKGRFVVCKALKRSPGPTVFEKNNHVRSQNSRPCT
jgi:hypothetical protein